MKRKFIYILLASVCLVPLFSSCDNFGDVNIDPEHPTENNMNYNTMFTGSQVFVAGRDWADWRNGLIYCGTMLQHLSSVQGYWNGDKYTYNSGYNSAYFDYYTDGIKKVVDTHNAWKDDPDRVNELQMVRIVKVILFHRMTDMYGDVPYTDAGLGYIAGIHYPKYDRQEDIYMDMLKELEEAATTLDPSIPSRIGSADIMHGGDVEAWRRTAYSMMLRLGMRLSKVNPTEAQVWVNKALAGGLISSNAENCIIEHENVTDDAANAFGKTLCYLDPNAYRVSQTFIDHLRNTNDPRLPYIATVCQDPSYTILDDNFQLGDTTAVNQLGMPNGYDRRNGTTDISLAPNWPGDINRYSVVNRYTYSRLDAPTFVVTYAENQLLLAEAAFRGWIAGNPKDYYDAGVTAAMEQFIEFGVRGITSAQITKYLTDNPYNPADALNQINTQYWVVTFMDEYETFANWRRSGYPVLQPVNYFGNVTNGTIPRRFTYAISEVTGNSANYREAVSRLTNGDTMTSRVWWDVQ